MVPLKYPLTELKHAVPSQWTYDKCTGATVKSFEAFCFQLDMCTVKPLFQELAFHEQLHFKN